MSVWLACAVALCVGVTACGVGCLRASLAAAVVALEVAGVATALALLVLSVHFQRQAFADLALVLVVLSFAGALSFLRFMERKP